MPKTKSKRQVLYREPSLHLFAGHPGAELTVDKAKKFLDWNEVEDKSFLFRDEEGRGIRCINAEKFQRRFIKMTCEKLKWDILEGHWQLNFETVVIGKTGLVLDGKHRLIALVLAAQLWEKEPERFPAWKKQPQIPIAFAFGSEETKEVVNTIGTGTPRSLADSLYASGLFKGVDKRTMTKLCRMTQHAVRLLWVRTGAQAESNRPGQASHAECLDFLERHPSILKCVRWVFDHEKDIVQLISPGYASALHYLMSVVDTDPEEYHDSEDPLELSCTVDMELAGEFWTALVNRDKSVDAIVKKIASLTEGGNTSAFDRMAVLIKGWNYWREYESVTRKAVSIRTKVDDFGVRHLLEDPKVGGIDLGMDQ